MAALRRPLQPTGGISEEWVSEIEMIEDPSVARARQLAHAVLVEASLKVANIRSTAHSTLLEARTEAEEIREDARAEAARESERILAEAHRNANLITDRALDQRDLLVTATLGRIAELSVELMGMADGIVAHAEDPAVARAQLAQFMLSLTDMAEQIETDPAGDPRGAVATLEVRAL